MPRAVFSSSEAPRKAFAIALLVLVTFVVPAGVLQSFAQQKQEVKCSKCSVSNMKVTGAWKQCSRCGKWYCPSCQGGKSSLDCCKPNISGIKNVCSTCGVTSHQVSGNWRKCPQCGKKYCFQCQKNSTASPCCNKRLELIQ